MEASATKIWNERKGNLLFRKIKNPAGAMLESLASLLPNITVYFICKTFKKFKLRRMDVVNVLSRHVVTPMNSTR